LEKINYRKIKNENTRNTLKKKKKMKNKEK
jgi:hypothetical protein